MESQEIYRPYLPVVKMSSYVILWSWSEKGVENVKDALNRLGKLERLLESKGGRLASFYMTFGQYDGVTIVEAPDDATMGSILLSTESAGTARSVTLKAFTYDEASKIIGSLS